MRLALLAVVLLTLSPAPAAMGARAAAAPTAQPPTVDLQAPGTVTAGAVPVVVRWPAATPSGSAIKRYELQRSADDSGWINVSLASRLSRSVTVKLGPWQVHTFRVRAIAKNGTVGEWATAAPLWLSATQGGDESVELSPGWQSVADSKAFGGERVMTGTAGESASFSFVGSEVGWVAPRGKGKGRADVYLDGTLATQIDLRKSSAARRQVVFRASWPASGPHSIEVVVQGTAGRPNVDIDAFVVLGEATTQTIVGAGDIARCLPDSEGNVDPTQSGAYRTAQVVQGVDGIVFTAGDNSQSDGSDAEFANCYDPTWGPFKDRTRPSPGNHDYITPGATGYYGYFGDNAGPAGRGWYRYDAGTWRVYSLNSECGPATQCYADQLVWLAADLSAEPHRCVLAYWHRPRFSTGEHGNSTRMAAAFGLLYDHGADLVLSGHDHTYQRFAPLAPDGTSDPAAGIRQIVIGTGGASLYQFESENPMIEVRDNTTHGVLRLDLAPGSYSWEFLGAGAGTFTDSGSDTCY